MTLGVLLALRSVDYFDELERTPFDRPASDPCLDDGSLAPRTVRIDTMPSRKMRWLLLLSGVLGLAVIMLATRAFLHQTTALEHILRPIAEPRRPRRQHVPHRQLVTSFHTKTRTAGLARHVRRRRAYVATERAAPDIIPVAHNEPAFVAHTVRPQPRASYSEAPANETRDFGYLGRR